MLMGMNGPEPEIECGGNLFTLIIKWDCDF